MQTDAFDLIRECLTNYSIPIYVIGEMEVNNGKYLTNISATIPRDQLVIINDKKPEWYLNVIDNSLKEDNILYITDFEQISTEEQKLFLDIICKNTISSEKLPDNLKIVINSLEKCPLLPEIMECVQYVEI